MRPLTLVGLMVGLAGAVAATTQLARQPLVPPDLALMKDRPPLEIFPAHYGDSHPVSLASDPSWSFPPAPPGMADDPFMTYSSPEFLLSLGFSFIVGLAVGFAFKVAFKLALLGGGLLLIVLFSLQYAGFIDINWVGMEAGYGSFAAWFGAYAHALKAFMSRNLSNAAAFVVGLLLGFRI